MMIFSIERLSKANHKFLYYLILSKTSLICDVYFGRDVNGVDTGEGFGIMFSKVEP